MEIDATKTSAEGREIFVVAKSHSKQKRGLKAFDTTLEFAQTGLRLSPQNRTHLCHQKRVATTCCPGLWFV